MPFTPLRPAHVTNPLYRLSRVASRHWKLLSLLALLVFLELIYHIHSFEIVRPATDLDPPFHVGCQEPVLNTTARANATLVMLARNSDIDGAVHSVSSVQRQFNERFNYTWVFLNNEPWSEAFMVKVKQAGAGAEMVFETIPLNMWSYPGWIDKDMARERMSDMERQGGIPYAGAESYHLMCRFQSG